MIGSSVNTLTESSYYDGGPPLDCSYIQSHRLDIFRMDAPHYTTQRSALDLIELGMIVLTFVFLTRHRSQAYFTRFLDFSMMPGGIKRSIQLAYVTYMILQDCRLRQLSTFLFFISSHQYCATIKHTIVYGRIGSHRAKTHHYLPCRT